MSLLEPSESSPIPWDILYSDQRNRAKPAATSAMAAAPLLPLLNWAASPANVGRVVGSAVGVMERVYVAFSGPPEGEVLLSLPLPPVDAEPFPEGEADAEPVRVGLYVMAVLLAVTLEDLTASAVLVVSGEEASAVGPPELEEKGQWKGIEDAVEGIDDVAVALSGSDEKGQWKGMDDEVPVPNEVGPGPW
jgi:hypothetical protein